MTMLDDGFSTKINFSTSTITFFQETEVTPPAFKGGGKKNVTTMDNLKVRTFAPKKIYEMDDISLTVRYDPAILNEIKAAIQVNQLLEIVHPDGSKWQVWGWLEEFNPSNNAEGEVPTADIVLSISNLNYAGDEAVPVFVAA